MRILFVHPSPLMYSEIYLRLEPLRLELVAESARRAGHDVRLLDLQVFRHSDYYKAVDQWKPDAVGFSAKHVNPKELFIHKPVSAQPTTCGNNRAPIGPMRQSF